MKISDLKIGQRLGAGFGVIGILFVIMVVSGNSMLSRLNGETAEIVDVRIPVLASVYEFDGEMSAVAIALRNMMLTNSETDRKQQQELIMQSRVKMQETLATLQTQMNSELGLKKRDEMVAKFEAYAKGVDAILRILNDGDLPGAATYLAKDLRPLLAQLRTVTAEQLALQRKLTSDAAAESAQVFSSTQMLTLFSGLATLAFGALIAWLLTRSITRPMAQAVDVATKVAGGDLTSDIVVPSKDETGQLLQALKDMNAQLASTVGSVRLGADTIAVAAGQVAAGNQDLSSRTEQQAGALEETASSMEELTATVKQNADNARQANVLAETASNVAERGGDVIGRVVGTMDEISAASNKISDIIGVIDGIAFQTNILALNAAVEAARAGEQGRGFAVVAGEVRNLAQRSAAAAREIKELINDSTGKTAAGSKLVLEAGDTMKEIVESVRRVTDIMSEISAASHEQTAGIEQINQSITQLDETTQQNAALVEEAAAASGAMQDQAARLAEAVSVFKIAQSAQQGAGMAGSQSRALLTSAR